MNLISKMCLKLILYVLLFCHLCCGVLSFNEKEYYTMPPLYHWEPYEPCVYQDNVYCTVEFDVYADIPNDIYNTIQEYSSQKFRYFNHSKLQYGICIAKTSLDDYKSESLNVYFETQLNETFWRNYQLKARVTDVVDCIHLHRDLEVDISDVIVAAAIFVLLILNVAGTLQARSLQKHKFLECFSIAENWKALCAPPGEGSEPWRTLLKGLSGIRAITSTIIVMLHYTLPFAFLSKNPLFFERIAQNKFFMMYGNATLVVQTFLVMSGFLLAINTQNSADKKEELGVMKQLLKRFLRLAPVYIVIMALTITWFRHVSSGPIWQVILGSEIEQCRHNWIYNLLYLNNYMDENFCMLHTWYLAADFQFHIIGLIVLLYTDRRRNLILVLLFLVGVISPAAHTHFQDLDGTLLFSPEVARKLLVRNPTFDHLHKRTHTNISSFIIGLALGSFVYRCQKTGSGFKQCVRHRYLYWMTFPALVLMLFSGTILYQESTGAFIRSLFAAFYKPLFGAINAFIITGMVFQFEEVYRGVLEWRGWAVMSRLSYCVYLVHIPIIRLVSSTRTSLMDLSYTFMLETAVSTLVFSFLVAMVFHLLVEAPFQQMIKLYLFKRKKYDQEKNKKQ